MIVRAAEWLVETKAGNRVCIVISVLMLPLTFPATVIQVGWPNACEFMRLAVKQWKRDWRGQKW